MSKGYDDYLEEHIGNVRKAARWMVDSDIHVKVEPNYAEPVNHLGLTNDEFVNLLRNVQEHDESKYDEEEYDAYDGYFYLGVHDDDAFNRAWLHHIHHNPHHWQHWLLMMDDGKYRDPGKIVALEMPREYVIEMVADWWAFSWKSGNLFEVFDWYEKHRDCIVLHENTRRYLESVLDAIRTKLESE